MEKIIRIIPVVRVDPGVMKFLCMSLQETFKRECCPGEALPAPDYAFNPHRSQYAAGEILHRLRTDGSERVLGVVELDLYVPNLNFVFGLADQLGQRAIVSLIRLHQEFYDLPEDQGLFLQRSLKEAIHELGHTYGLNHCQDRRCVMTFSNSLADTDFNGQGFCLRCRSKF